MPIESIQGFRAAKQEAINASNTSTYRDKYIHIEWIEDNYYQLNIHGTYLGDGNSDIIGCYRNGEYVKSHQEMIDEVDFALDGQDYQRVDTGDFDEDGDGFSNENNNPIWSDDAEY